MCPPEAIGALTAVAALVEVPLATGAVFLPESPITQPTTPAGISSANIKTKIAPSITGIGTLRFDIPAHHKSPAEAARA